MVKQKEEIEEAVIVEESTAILLTDFKAPVLPKLINKDQSIEKIRESLKTYDDVVIEGTKDKENYTLVSKGMAKMKSDRIAWKKAVTENLSEPVAKWLAETKLEISAIETEFKDAESTLRTKKEAIDNLKAEEKQAAETAKLKVMSERIEVIVNLGGKSDGTRYLFDYDMTLSISLTSLKDLEEKKWLIELKEIQNAWDFEQKRLADQKLVEEQLSLANATKEKELHDKQIALRIKELKFEGFMPRDINNTFFDHPNGNFVADIHINEYTVEEWDALILSLQYSEALEYNGEDSLDDMSLSLAQDQEFNDGVAKGAYSEINPTQELAFNLTEDNNVDLPFNDDVKAEEEIAEMSNDNGLVFVGLEFDALDPYIEFEMGKGYIQRIFHPSFKDYATELTPTQQIVLQGEVNEDLQFVFIKVG